MKVALVRAWPRRFDWIEVELPDGARVADALQAAGWAGTSGPVECPGFGVVADATTMLHDGDRLELLRALLVDPKEARRPRAGQRAG